MSYTPHSMMNRITSRPCHGRNNSTGEHQQRDLRELESTQNEDHIIARETNSTESTAENHAMTDVDCSANDAARQTNETPNQTNSNDENQRTVRRMMVDGNAPVRPLQVDVRIDPYNPEKK